MEYPESIRQASDDLNEAKEALGLAEQLLKGSAELYDGGRYGNQRYLNKRARGYRDAYQHCDAMWEVYDAALESYYKEREAAGE